ncbi:MAG: hypothetical protein CSA75_00045 [Sorangium cellulosum]|nr:MAG: hypothetical protein CSA75_00045 [Sorangium cellulosum]
MSEKGDVSESFRLIDVRRSHVLAWVSSQYIDPATRQILDELTALNETAAELARQTEEREAEIEEIFSNQERLRTNLQALGSSHDEKELRERYVAELAAEEDKLRVVRAEIRRLKVDRKQADANLRSRIANLNIERKLGG